MDMVYKNLPMEICTVVIMSIACLQVKGFIIGLIKVILREILLMGSGKVKESGKKEREIAINMMGTTRVIKNGAMDSLLGQVEMSTKAIMKAMYVAAMEKCFGLKGVNI